MGDLDGQRRLADAAHTVDGTHDNRSSGSGRRVRQEGAERGQLVFPTREIGDRAGQLPWDGSASRGTAEPSQLLGGPLALEVSEVVIELIRKGR